MRLIPRAKCDMTFCCGDAQSPQRVCVAAFLWQQAKQPTLAALAELFWRRTLQKSPKFERLNQEKKQPRPSHSGKQLHKLTFAVAVGTSEDGAFLDAAEGLKEAPHVVLWLLLVEHADEELSVFWKETEQVTVRGSKQLFSFFFCKKVWKVHQSDTLQFFLLKKTTTQNWKLKKDVFRNHWLFWNVNWWFLNHPFVFSTLLLPPSAIIPLSGASKHVCLKAADCYILPTKQFFTQQFVHFTSTSLDRVASAIPGLQLMD